MIVPLAKFIDWYAAFPLFARLVQSGRSNAAPLVPKENILLIEGIHDLFAETQPIEELWQKWQQPEIWRLPHGHVTGKFVLGLTGCVLRWLALRLEAG